MTQLSAQSFPMFEYLFGKYKLVTFNKLSKQAVHVIYALYPQCPNQQ